MICGGRGSSAKAKVWYCACKYNSESKLISQSTDLVLQPQAPIQGLLHGKFQVNWFLLDTFGNRFVFCLRDQPQSQSMCVLMQKDIETHLSHWNRCQQTLCVQTMYTISVECDACHIAWVLGSVQRRGSSPPFHHYSSASWLHVQVFSCFLHWCSWASIPQQPAVSAVGAHPTYAWLLRSCASVGYQMGITQTPHSRYYQYFYPVLNLKLKTHCIPFFLSPG